MSDPAPTVTPAPTVAPAAPAAQAPTIVHVAAPEQVDPADVTADTPAPKGWEDRPGAWRNFRKAIVDARTAKEDAAKVAAERDEWKAKAATFEQTVATTRARYEFESAMASIGVTDPDDAAEFASRYERVQPGEDGKRPTAKEWAKAIKERPPKWATGYLATPDDDDEPVVTVRTRVEERQVRQPEADPNAGVRDNGRRVRVWTDEAVARLSPEEYRKHRAEIVAQSAGEGVYSTKEKWGRVG